MLWLAVERTYCALGGRRLERISYVAVRSRFDSVRVPLLVGGMETLGGNQTMNE
jgi:hypothetical protein